jgi:hypothetical protein
LSLRNDDDKLGRFKEAEGMYYGALLLHKNSVRANIFINTIWNCAAAGIISS